MNPSQDQQALLKEIEAAFAQIDRASLRRLTRDLERLIAQVADDRLRARYEGALDALPEMVRHTDTGPDL